MNPVLGSKPRNLVRPEANWVSILEIGAKEVIQTVLPSELKSLPNLQNLK